MLYNNSRSQKTAISLLGESVLSPPVSPDKISLMKKLLAIIILSLCFITSSKADDIRDFQIEGISIGDSLLKFVDKNTILSSRKYTYKDDKFYSLDIWSEKFQNYEVIQFHLKKNDNNYKIHGLSGALLFGKSSRYYPESEKLCKEKKNSIEIEIDKLFENAKKYSKNFVGQGSYDPEVIRQETYFLMDSGQVWLQCATWGKKAKVKHNIIDNLRISILSNEFDKWMTNEAY